MYGKRWLRVPGIVICLLLTFRAAAADFAPVFERIKRDSSPAELYALLYDLPKGGDIHHHLGLSFLAEDLWDAAVDPAVTRGNEFYARVRISDCPPASGAGPALPPLLYLNIQRSTFQRLSDCQQSDFIALRSLNRNQREGWLSSLKLDQPGEGRTEFFEAAVARTTGLVRDPNILFDQITRMLKRYQREKVRYLETQTGVTGMVNQQGEPIPPAEFARQLSEYLGSNTVRDTGVTVRLQTVVIRFLPEAEKRLEEAYALVAANRDYWVGVNMAGREDNDKGYALRFLDTFRRMRRRYSGVHLSIHAGEKDSPGPEVRNTLLLGAERIGHGFNLISDPDAMLLMRNGRNLVEVSLVSNQLLEYSPDVSSHPFAEYLRFGIPVCLNTDDSGVWDSQLTDDYFLAVRNFDLTWNEVVRIGRASLEHSFAQAEVKQKMLAGYDRAIADFEASYSTENWSAKLALLKPPVSGYAKRRLNLGSGK